jgi:gliding motility-associated-like protein
MKIKNSLITTGCLFSLCLSFFDSYPQVVSDFSSSADGWSTIVVNASQSYAPTYNSTGGNPAGNLSVDLTTASPYYFYPDRFFDAPAKFLGNKSLSYNRALTFDLQQTQNGSNNTAAEVVITGGGISIYYPITVFPSTSSWSSYSVLLKETAGWKTGFVGGAATTLNEMKTVLANITSFRIRSQFIGSFTGSYSGRLDNVVLNVAALATPPTITSFSPLSGIPIISSVTISGNNFNATATSNAVYFGGVKATVTSASSTQLVVSVPKGAHFAPITVIDLSTGLEASTVVPFQPRFDNNKDYGGQIIRATMAPAVALDLEATAGTPATGDIDGDGLNDIVVGEGGGGLGGVHKFSVFRNAGVTGDISSASFFPKVSFDCVNLYVKGFVTLADFDGDGKLDVAVSTASVSNAYVTVFQNTSTPGAISFSAPQHFLGYSYSDGPLTSADMDGDGRPEIIAIFNNNCGSSDRLYMYENLSTPGNIDFAAIVTFGNVYTCGGHIAIGDLDGDKLTDVIVEAGGSVTVFQNSSTPGNLIMATPFVLSSTGNGRPVIADLDNDGKADVAWPKSSTDVEIRKNIHAGGLLSAASFSSGIIITAAIGSNEGTSQLIAGDINSDGKVDLVLSGNTDLGIFQNVSTAGVLNATSFLPGIPYASNLGTAYLGTTVVTDFDGDNKLDVLTKVTNTAPAKLLIFRNDSYPAPRIDNLSATSGAVSSTVTLTGDYFSTGNSPTISGRVGATVTAITPSSNTSASVTIPSTVVSGRINITEHNLSAFSKPFNVLFGTNRIINSASFAGGIDFAMATGTKDALAIADFDDDGKPDVIVADGVTKIFQNTHATAGQPITSTSLALQSTTYTIGYNLIPFDIDGDGKVDLNNGYGLLKNNSTPGSISLLYGPNGAYTYSSSFNYVAAADFNKDGKTDVAETNGTAFVQLYENRSTKEPFANNSNLSTFSVNAVNLVKPGNYGGIVAADFDNDGYDDIATVTPATDNFTVYQNLKLYGPIQVASFSSGTNITTGDQPNSLTADDFDGDGKMDIAVTHFNTTFVSVYLNTSTASTITFAAPINLTCANKGFNIASQDLDGDGKTEVVVIHQPNPGPGSFTVFKNSSTVGNVNFAPAINYALTRNPQALSIADVNADQKPDILIVGSGGSTAPANALTIFENKITTLVMSITSQPIGAAVCDGTTVNLNTGATGTSNVVYQWQKFNTGTSSFVDVSNVGGYSGATLSTLSINTSGNFGAGTYRCKVDGDFVATQYTSSASITVNVLPIAPTTSGASTCIPSAVTLNAAGASNGQYVWYSTPTGGAAFSGQVNSSFTTPVINATTTFYAAINDGTCESSRTPVIATLISAPTAPTASGVNTCVPASVTITAAGGSNGNYRWYTVSTSGTAIAGEVNSTYTTPVITVNTTYYVSIFNGTCESTRTQVSASLNPVTLPKPVVTSSPVATGGTVTICEGQSAVLTAPAGFSYTWSNGAATQANTVSAANGYTVVVKNSSGCMSPASDAITVIVTVCDSPPQILPTSVETQVEGKVTLNLTSLLSDPDDNLDLTTLKIVKPPLSGARATIDAKYNLVIDYAGISFSGNEKLTIEVCDTKAKCTQEEISIEVAGDIVVYSGFSPNGDDKNPIFFIQYIDVMPDTKKNHVSIFNRWGDVVFETDNYDNVNHVFRGLNSNGNELPTGTYFYKIEFTTGKKTRTGYISLKR